jgi:cytochrome c556
MQLISYHTGILGDMAKGEMEFDVEKAQAAATNLHAASIMDRTTLWIEGTEQGAVEGSRAKAEIWTDAAGFDTAFTALQDASAAMMEVSDLDGVRAGIGDVGKSCGGCHDDYRGPRN